MKLTRIVAALLLAAAFVSPALADGLSNIGICSPLSSSCDLAPLSSSQAQKEITANEMTAKVAGLVANKIGINSGDADTTLTFAEATNYASLEISGTLTANRNLIVPAGVLRLYDVANKTTGGFGIIVKTPSGTGITIAAGGEKIVRNDGTNVVAPVGGATSCSGLSDASAFCNGTNAANLTGTAPGAILPPIGGGDVSCASGGGSCTIANNTVTNAKIATTTANTVKGNFTGLGANVADNTAPDCHGANQFWQYTAGTGLSCGSAAGGSGGVGTVTTTGSPAAEDMTKFSGSTTITRSGLTSDGIAQRQTNTTKLASGKAVTVAASGSQTLLSYSGRGHIKRIWFAAFNSGDSNASVPTSTITITRDGEGTPSINALQLRDLFNERGLASWQFYESDRIAGNGGGTATPPNAPQFILIDIPCESSLTVSYTNASATSSALIWWMIEYADDDANLNRGTREHLHAAKISTTVTAYSEQTLLDIAGPAMFVGLAGQWRGGDANYHYQEGAVKAYIDSEGTASWASSGTEDFFQQAGFSGMVGPGTGITLRDIGAVVGDATANITYYRWLHEDPIYGASHLKLTWTAGNASISTVTNATAIDLVVWYYTAS